MDTKELDRFLKSCVDLTTLNPTDTESSVTSFIRDAVSLDPLPATICVYPSLVEAAGVALGDTSVGLTAVCGAFPSSQTFLEVKLLEVAMAIENGADEIDVPIPIGEVMESNFDRARSELAAIREEIGDEAVLKVILETGTLADPQTIYKASMAAIDAGADFIKTSTGKSPVGATPEAFETMCRAVYEHYSRTGRYVGLKCSGGVSTLQKAKTYYEILVSVLGKGWLTPNLFRIGTSHVLQ